MKLGENKVVDGHPDRATPIVLARLVERVLSAQAADAMRTPEMVRVLNEVQKLAQLGVILLHQPYQERSPLGNLPSEPNGCFPSRRESFTTSKLRTRPGPRHSLPASRTNLPSPAMPAQPRRSRRSTASSVRSRNRNSLKVCISGVAGRWTVKPWPAIPVRSRLNARP